MNIEKDFDLTKLNTFGVAVRAKFFVEIESEAELAERAGDLEKVAQILYGALPQAEKEYAAFERKHFAPKRAKNREATNPKTKPKNTKPLPSFCGHWIVRLLL